METPKPILVVYFDTKGATAARVNEILTSLSAHFKPMEKEYHVLILPSLQETKVEVFYEKDFQKKSVDEMKELIENKLSELCKH